MVDISSVTKFLEDTELRWNDNIQRMKEELLVKILLHLSPYDRSRRRRRRRNGMKIKRIRKIGGKEY
jgi:hypothetical protein